MKKKLGKWARKQAASSQQHAPPKGASAQAQLPQKAPKKKAWDAPWVTKPQAQPLPPAPPKGAKGRGKKGDKGKKVKGRKGKKGGKGKSKQTKMLGVIAG